VCPDVPGDGETPGPWSADRTPGGVAEGRATLAPASSELTATQVLTQLAIELDMVTVDEWPALREEIMKSDIVILVTSTLIR
jgi:hypothetical protein